MMKDILEGLLLLIFFSVLSGIVFMVKRRFGMPGGVYRRLLYGIVAFCLAAAIILCTGCAAADTAEVMDTTVTVRTESAKSGELTEEGSYIATIENTEEVAVISRVSENVTALNVKVGDAVKGGDTLCRLDDTAAKIDYQGAQIGVQSAEASVNTAKAGLNSAQASYENTKHSGEAKLGSQRALSDYQNQQNIISQQQAVYDMEDQIKKLREGGYSNASGAVSSAQNNVAQAEQKVKDAQAGVAEAEKSGDADKIAAAKTVLSAAQSTLQSAKSVLSNAQSSYSSTESSLETMRSNLGKQEDALRTAQGARDIMINQVYADEETAVEDSMKMAQASVDSAQANVESAQVGVSSAQNKLATAGRNISLYSLTTPIDGIVEAVNVEKNNYVSAGSVCFVISNPDSRMAVFHVPDTVAARMQMGQEVMATANGKDYAGEISEIGVATDETGLFMIKANIYDADELADGISVKLRTAIKHSEGGIKLPTDAIYFKNNQAFVYAAEKGKAVEKPVTVDIYGEEESAISDGLTAGEEIIVSWSGALKDGAPIKITDGKEAEEK